MENSDRTEIVQLLTAIAELYGKDLSKAALRLYLEILKPYPIEKIKQAAQNILSTKTFNKFPLPAEFIEYISPKKDLELLAHEAAEKVLDMNEFQGGLNSVAFDDPVIHATINRLGGWPKVADEINNAVRTNRIGFWRNDFKKMYQATAKTPNLGRVPERLIGKIEADNIAEGYLDGNVLHGKGGDVLIDMRTGAPKEILRIEDNHDNT